MTAKALQQGGQLVRVTTSGFGGAQSVVELYDVAVANPLRAESAVSQHIEATDDKIEAIEPLSQSAVDALGLKPREVRKRA